MNKDTEYPIVDIERLKAKGVDAPAAYVMLHLRKQCDNAPSIFAYRALYSKGIKFIVKDLQQCKNIADIERLREQYISIIYTVEKSSFRNILFSDVAFDYTKTKREIDFDIDKNKIGNNLAIFRSRIRGIFGIDFFNLLFIKDLHKYTYLLDIKNQEKWFQDELKWNVDITEKGIVTKEEDLLAIESISKDSLVRQFYRVIGSQYSNKDIDYDQIRDYMTFEYKKDLIDAKIRLQHQLSQKFKPTDPWTLLDYPNLYHAPAFVENFRNIKTPQFVSQLESFEQRLLTLDF